ncbi:MAG: hypothetical protein JWO19_626 [Bryobacterales bacterium]|nr:hypothetical protein [Bryobacterales bacterium]
MHFSAIDNVKLLAMSQNQAPDKRPAEPAHIRAGPIWDQNCRDAKEATGGPSAVLVFHGMGQQVKFETISAVAGAIRDEARAQGGVTKDLTVHLSRVEDQFLARAEIAWQDASGGWHEVHVYEAYWAPLTEGLVSYWDTLKFLFQAGWQGLRYSWPLGSRTFRRWMFGGPQVLPIDAFVFPALLAVLTVLLLQVGIIALVSLRMTQWLTGAVALPAGIGWLVLWIAVIAEALVARYFLVQYVGDIAAYVSPYKSSKFDELRKRIQKVGLDIGKVIYGVDPAGDKGYPDYSRILLVGHSLGSVLAYDTLNALINMENTGSAKPVLARTPALITFGSPLDKTAFIFRTQREDWIREQMAAAMQPLIVDYEKYRPPSFTWVNIWSKWDIISGELNYYDVSETHPRHVQNMEDLKASVPLKAHIQYWKNPMLRKLLYEFVG